MDEPPPKVLDLVQQLEDSLTRAKEARDAKVSGDEHPSGLRDAIAQAIYDADQTYDETQYVLYADHLADVLFPAVRAWLSVVSEEEIAAAARVIHERHCSCVSTWPRHLDAFAGKTAAAALAASREVLIPKEKT